MTEGPQKFFLTCSECNDRMLIVIPANPDERQERRATCSKGHTMTYDERTLLEPAAAGDSKARG